MSPTPPLTPPPITTPPLITPPPGSTTIRNTRKAGILIMSAFLFLTAWLYSGATHLVRRARGRVELGDERLDNDAGMTTLEILLWAAAAVVAVGLITTAIFLWLKNKSTAVTQK